MKVIITCFDIVQSTPAGNASGTTANGNAINNFYANPQFSYTNQYQQMSEASPQMQMGTYD